MNIGGIIKIMNKTADILDNLSKVIAGKRNVSELVLTSIIAGGTQAGKKKDIFGKICRDGSLYCNMSRIRYWWNTLSG